jgi:hypothetical protein
MRDSRLTRLPGRPDTLLVGIDEAVIDEGGPVESGQIRLIVSTMAYRHGDSMKLKAGVFQAIGESRPLANNPNQYATTVIHLSQLTSNAEQGMVRTKTGQQAPIEHNSEDRTGKQGL